MWLEKRVSTIKGDSTMLRQVIHNLLQNAQDALAEKMDAVIMVRTKIEDVMLVLTVEDNGVGFPAQMLLHAFEPYMTTKSHGTGLGLAIVKKIIEEHKGSIKIENISEANEQTGIEKNIGAIVTISIPLEEVATR